MRIIGLIGGMSWESSAEYYRLINRRVRDQLGGNANAKSLMLTVNFAEIEAWQHQQDWNRLAEEMARAALQLQAGGADCVLLCTNTMHKVANVVQAAVSIPLLHIAEATSSAIQAKEIKTIGLMGTRFTMEDGFYQDRMAAKGIQTIVPEPESRLFLHRAIYDELCQGILKDSTRLELLRIIQQLAQDGATGVVLGCTELGLLIRQEDVALPLFDTTQLHAAEAVRFALSAGSSRHP